MNKRIFVFYCLLCSILLNAGDKLPMPPSMPSIDKKSVLPDSCNMVPPMILFLPPPLEKNLIKCKNDIKIPKKKFVQKQLSKLLKKKIVVNTITVVPKFNQLYKVVYNKNKTILVNQYVDAFIRQ